MLECSGAFWNNLETVEAVLTVFPKTSNSYLPNECKNSKISQKQTPSCPIDANASLSISER